MKAFLFILLGTLCVVLCSGCAIFSSPLSADPIDSQVVDADTGQPIEGAVVVAHWELHQGSLTGDSLPCGAANVEEAVTDKDGRFHIPGWGPTRFSCGDMRQGNPTLFVFKSGYSPGGFNNASGSLSDTSTVTRTHSAWANRQMKLQKFPNTDMTTFRGNSNASLFYSFNSALELFVVDIAGECNWKKIPNMLRALMEEEQHFNAAGLKIGSLASRLSIADESIQKDAPQCGSPKAFIEELTNENTPQH